METKPVEIDKQEIKFLGDMQRLRMEPGDICVLKTKDIIRQDHQEALQRYWRENFPGHKLIVLERGMELGILGQQP